MKIEVVKEARHLSRLVPQWEDLAAHALEPNPLYEHWMLLPALETSHAREDFRCVLVWAMDPRAGGAARMLAGLFPLQCVRRFKGLPVSAWRTWLHSSWFLGTPLVRAECADPCLAAFFDWMERGGQAAPVLEFRYVPGDGAFYAALANRLWQRGCTVMVTDGFNRALLRRERDGETYLRNALPAQLRKSLRRKEKRLAERGCVRHVSLASGDEIEKWIDEFLALEASGWKGRLGTPLGSTEANRRFARAVFKAAFERGRLQIVGLDYDGRALSRCCNLLAGEGSFAFRAAHDEAFAWFSPGVMAEVDTIRAFHALSGTQWMDSITAPDNTTLNRLWKDRRTIQTAVVGLTGWGELWVSALPLLRLAKRASSRVGALALLPIRPAAVRRFDEPG